MHIWRYIGLNKCDFPELISFDTVTYVNETIRSNSPLSLQLLEGASNKCWEKLLNFVPNFFNSRP